jgi:hypothetical protein
VALVTLKPISELFTGTVTPPDFSRGPTPEYVLFFSVVEATALDYCTLAGKSERDAEFERIYKQLRKRPDGTDTNPLFSYIQSAFRLYMSVRNDYLRFLREPFHGLGTGK